MSPSTIDGIVHTSFDFGRMMRRRMMSHGKGDLHMTQLHVLALATEKSGITMSEIADFLQVSSPTATSVVDRLVRMGLLVRKHDKKNRTLVRLDVTTKGSAMLKKKMSEKKKVIAGILSVLEPSDRDALLRILTTLLEQSSRS